MFIQNGCGITHVSHHMTPAATIHKLALVCPIYPTTWHPRQPFTTWVWYLPFIPPHDTRGNHSQPGSSISHLSHHMTPTVTVHRLCLEYPIYPTTGHPLQISTDCGGNLPFIPPQDTHCKYPQTGVGISHLSRHRTPVANIHRLGWESPIYPTTGHPRQLSTIMHKTLDMILPLAASVIKKCDQTLCLGLSYIK